MKRKLCLRSKPMTAFIVLAAIGLLWAASMLGVTVKTAGSFADYYASLGRSQSRAVATVSRQMEEASGTWDEGLKQYRIASAIAYANDTVAEVRVGNDGGIYFSSLKDVEFQSAAAFYDGEGNLIANSGDYFYFNYDTEEVWNSADPDDASNTCGFAKVMTNVAKLDEQNPGLLEKTGEKDWRCFISGFNISAMRFTGVLDGTTLIASKIEYVLRDAFQQALYSREPDEQYTDTDGSEVTSYRYSVGEVISTENVPWHTLFESGETPENEVTLYTTQPHFSDYTSYTSRDSFLPLSLRASGTREKLFPDIERGTKEITILSMSHIYDYDKLVPDGEGGEVPATKYIVTTAMRFFPLKAAMKELTRFYISTGALALSVALFVFLKLKRRLIEPALAISAAVSNGYSPTDSDPADWHEVKRLYEDYNATLDKLRSDKNEITRLNAALDYANTAEQTRRQMTSNIAHELKTPLAVIHSYAEGLREHIADDKRDKYLDVILSESERMDAMVLEMLDLSRLEAGKVKLARDEFSLTALTHAVFEKLQPATEAKSLNIAFDFPEDCVITADEARIAQVIENFATNAVKYTPVGGRIHVRISVVRGGISFSVENDSKPFSNEELSQIWDTFYRTEEARSGGSTGLGLAIAKSIVELHGGKCDVRNTKTGVAFSFTIK